MEKLNQIRAALYLRVSTTDKGQETDNQLLQLREFCDRSGWDIFDIYIDKESGRKGKRQRSDFARLFDDAAKRKFDVVLFWSLDRFTRAMLPMQLLSQMLNGCGL